MTKFILFKLTAEAGSCGIILLLLPFYGHYTGQPALAGTPVKNKVVAKFYCLHAILR